ncbi:hypothetical protein F4775DRAFT_600493 [Biscogniauxia sp. FL1348]|nr:hypothetical protein F4775DRAFT_600493 [Biscogniauxia sp. FL1348]
MYLFYLESSQNIIDFCLYLLTLPINNDDNNNTPSTMPGLNDLPAELTCQILESLSIDDIFNARLVNRWLVSVIDSNIKTIAYRIARQDFPRARLLLRPTREGGAYDLAWLRTLIPRRLASIVLDKHRVNRQHSTTSYVLYIPAEDDFGDELRGRLAAAWCLLKRINDIYSAVYALPPSAAPTLAAREDLVYARALALVEGLEPQQCESFCLLAYLLLSAFDDRDTAPDTWRRHLTFHAAQPGEPRRFLDCRPRLRCCARPTPSPLFLFSRTPSPSKTVVADSRHPDRGNAWIWAFLFRHGAHAFHRQWIRRGAPPDHVANRLRALWAARATPQIAAERDTAARVWYALVARSRGRAAAPPPNYEPLRNPPNDYAFPAIDRWLRLRRQLRHGSPSKSMLAWYLWQLGRVGIDGVVEDGGDWGVPLDRVALLLENREEEEMDPLSEVPYGVSFSSVECCGGAAAAMDAGDDD